jgi:NTE family protein
MTTALLLSGGGARGAYQVGVLKAVAEILPKNTHLPFPIITGTSTGAINALAIAGRAGPFRLRIRKLEYIWRTIEPCKVYRTDPWGLTKNVLKVILSFLHSGYSIGNPVALLDNTPLRELLQKVVRFRHIDEAIASSELQAIAVNCMSYTSGKSISFYQADHGRKNWQRSRRLGIRTGLTVDHLMASSAIPILFPSRKIDGHYFGDGAIRQLKPFSAAINLGADKIFAVGVSNRPELVQHIIKPKHSPSIAQIMSHMINSGFIDAMESDFETLSSINRLIEGGSACDRADLGLADMKKIETLIISPSKSIDEIAIDFMGKLPWTIKLFLKAIGATAQGGGVSTTSYLLFEKNFCKELLKMGYHDAMQQEAEIRQFFNCPSTST